MPKKSSGGQRAPFNPGQQNQLPGLQPNAMGQQPMDMSALQSRFNSAPPMFRFFMQQRAQHQGIDPMQVLQNRIWRHQMNTGQFPGQGG